MQPDFADSVALQTCLLCRFCFCIAVSKKAHWCLPVAALFQLSLYAGFFSAVTMLPIESVVSVYPMRHGYNAAFFISCFLYFDLCRLLSSANRASDSFVLDLGPVWNLLFFRTGSIQGWGIALALLSAITYAVYLIQLERHRFNQMDSAVFTFYLSLCTIVMLMIVNLFTCSIQESSSCFNDMPLWLLGLLTVFSMFANICIAFGSRYLGASMTALFPVRTDHKPGVRFHLPR